MGQSLTCCVGIEDTTLCGFDTTKRTEAQAQALVARRREIAEQKRKEAQALEEAVRAAPNELPSDFHEIEASIENPVKKDIAEAEEWENAQDPDMQQYLGQHSGKTLKEIMANGDIPVDSLGNPIGDEYDLGRAGVMSEHTVVILNFMTDNFDLNKMIASLQAKDFKVVLLDIGKGATIQQMMVAMLTASVVWMQSGYQEPETGFDELVKSLVRFHHRGGGIMVMAENDPYYTHANVLLEALFPEEGIKFVGNDAGAQTIKVGDVAEGADPPPGVFRSDHVIFTGMASLYEGCTISYVPSHGPLKVLASYNNGSGYTGKGYCLLADSEVFAKCKEPGNIGRGRILLDGGSTKIWSQFFDQTPGTDRYVKNCCVWLLNVGGRIAPTQLKLNPIAMFQQKN